MPLKKAKVDFKNVLEKVEYAKVEYADMEVEEEKGLCACLFGTCGEVEKKVEDETVGEDKAPLQNEDAELQGRGGVHGVLS